MIKRLMKVKIMRKKFSNLISNQLILFIKTLVKKPLWLVGIALPILLCSVVLVYINVSNIQNAKINPKESSKPNLGPEKADSLNSPSKINEGTTVQDETKTENIKNATNGTSPAVSPSSSAPNNNYAPVDSLVVTPNHIYLGGKNLLLGTEISVTRKSGYNMLPVSMNQPAGMPFNLYWIQPDPVMYQDNSISTVKKLYAKYTTYFEDTSSGVRTITLTDAAGNTGSLTIEWSPMPSMYITQDSYKRTDLPDFVVYTANITINTNGYVDVGGTININFFKSPCREGSYHKVSIPYTGQKNITAECWVNRYIPPLPPDVPTLGSEGQLNYGSSIQLPNGKYIDGGTIYNNLGGNYDR